MSVLSTRPLDLRSALELLSVGTSVRVTRPYWPVHGRRRRGSFCACSGGYRIFLKGRKGDFGNPTKTGLKSASSIEIEWHYRLAVLRCCCHRLERPASPCRICAVTRGFETTTQDLSVFPFLPRHYHMTRVLLLPFIATVWTPVVLAIINII